MDQIITLSKENIANEHICCAFSDKKCAEGYGLKKAWLKEEFDNGYVFKRLDARAKVFIEYGPAETGWVPIEAPDYFLVNCFWVSGKYKGQGYGKELLRLAIEDAEAKGKNGLVTVVGTKKFHFMSDTKWLLRQGFESCDELPSGFSLLVRKLKSSAKNPEFKPVVKIKNNQLENGLMVFYSNRCPFTEYYVNSILTETAAKRKLPLTIHKLTTFKEAQSAPTPATIFSLFYNGHFITTDLSICIDSRFDKIFKI